MPPSAKDAVKVEQPVRMTKKRLSDDSDDTLASDAENKVTSTDENKGIFILSFIFLVSNDSISQK